MHKKFFKAIISVILVLAICSVTSANAFAASFGKSTYIKEFFISYGSTDDEAKKYLTDNGYEVIDHNLNEGADDAISKKRSVYLGYKTTDKSDEAITDMKLMNMKGGYSAQDYQMILNEQKESIQLFLEDFKIAVNEYRTNYKKNQERAIAAHEMLNMMYDDDTEQYIGDLLLNKFKEEYTDEEWNALSSEEQAKAADMTTIFMQANSNAILSIEQIIALATDDNDNAWCERYETAKTYDEMLQDVMSKNKVDASSAAKLLAAEYDEDAKLIAANLESYKESFLSIYTDAEIKITNTEEEITAYTDSHEDFKYTSWLAAGSQYEVLSILKNDDISLLELFTSDDFDPEGEDRYLLYPLVSVLSKGQRACLGFLPTYQVIALGINDDNTAKTSMETMNISSIDSLQNISIYDGIDRSLFADGNVALTNEALRLQASSGKNPTTSAVGSLSTTSIVLFSVFTFSAIMTTVSWATNSKMTDWAINRANTYFNRGNYLTMTRQRVFYSMKDAKEAGDAIKAGEELSKLKSMDSEIRQSFCRGSFYADKFEKIWKFTCVAMTCVTLVLLGLTAWSTYNDLKEYYNATFTPIPMRIIDEAVNDKDEKVFVNYDAVKCNRAAANMVTDSNKLLGDFGDLNGDVGRQWVALYTTTDKSAGDPITTDFKVQYNDTNIPDNTVALSMFGESVAQNLTNKKMGYTYADDKSGIYLFYGTDTSIFAGSVFSNGTYILCGTGALVICAVAIALIVKASKKKKANKEATANA